MYKCFVCNLITPPRVPCHKLIKKTRVKDYPYRARANAGYIKEDGKGYKTVRNKDKFCDSGGTGWEIVNEVNCCPRCLAKIEGRDEVENTQTAANKKRPIFSNTTKVVRQDRQDRRDDRKRDRRFNGKSNGRTDRNYSRS